MGIWVPELDARLGGRGGGGGGGGGGGEGPQPGSVWLSLAHVPLRFYRRENPLLDTSHYGPYPRELI